MCTHRWSKILHSTRIVGLQITACIKLALATARSPYLLSSYNQHGKYRWYHHPRHKWVSWVLSYQVLKHEAEMSRKPLISSHFPQHPPSYATSHIDTFNHALKLSQASPSSSTSIGGELEPIIWVNTLSKGAGGGVGMGGAALCHVEKEGLRFLVPVGHERESARLLNRRR